MSKKKKKNEDCNIHFFYVGIIQRIYQRINQSKHTSFESACVLSNKANP